MKRSLINGLLMFFTKLYLHETFAVEFLYTMYKPTSTSFNCETKSLGRNLTAFKNSNEGQQIETLVRTRAKRFQVSLKCFFIVIHIILI